MTLFATCEFATERLLVKEWHAAPGMGWPAVDLWQAVHGLMTESVTRHLPEAWRGPFSLARARAWVQERDQESPTLLVVDQASAIPVGLVIVFESIIERAREPSRCVDVRLGYLLDEAVWGQGLATELLAGFVDWCRSQPTIASITAGVAVTNEASHRALARLGFVQVTSQSDGADGELIYRLTIPV